MSVGYDPEREYLDSGAVVRDGSRWRCLECGATGDTVLGIRHVRGCWLHRLVDAIPALSSGNAAALPPPDLLWTLESKAGPAASSDVDTMVEWLRGARDDADRDAALDTMLETVPGLLPSEVAMFRGHAYGDDAPYEMLRALLLHLSAMPAEERMVDEGLAGIRRELARRGVDIDALTGAVDKGL